MPINAAGELTITPEDIGVQKHFFDAFGKMEMEISARWLVEFAQGRNEGWKSFTDEDINEFYHLWFPKGTFDFQGLTDKGFIRVAQKGHEEGSVYYFTEEFISRCYASASRMDGGSGCE